MACPSGNSLQIAILFFLEQSFGLILDIRYPIVLFSDKEV